MSGVAPFPLAPRTPFPAAVSAVYAAQLARGRVSRAPLLFVATLQSLGLLVLLRGVIAGGRVAEQRQVVAGATVLVVAFVALNLLAQRFGQLRATGGLDHYAALPVPPSAVVLGTAASYATFTLPGTAVVALVGAALYDLPLAHLWLVLPVSLAAGAALSGLGALIGLAAPRPELATVAGQLGMTLVLFLGMVRAARMPLPLRALRAVLPSTYATEALGEALSGRMRPGVVVANLSGCLVWGAGALLLATVAFRRAVAR
jgi:ABC-2 type transport system permease protein